MTFESFFNEQHLVLHGMAGTGKTFISLYLALNEIFSKHEQYNKLIIIRSAVPSRDVGFLPGRVEEKMKAYEIPYECMCTELFGRR